MHNDSNQVMILSARDDIENKTRILNWLLIDMFGTLSF